MVSLLNDSPYLIKIEDLTVSNNSLFFFAVNDQGKEFSGSLISPDVNDGLRINPVEEKTLVALKAKAQKSININLLNILGELPEGEYEVRATYSTGLVFVESKPSFFKISKSTPVYAKTVRDYMRTEINTIRTSWINKEEDGLYLFIMENSQYHPINIRSNRRILKIDDVQKVYPSLLASPDQETEHLLWVEENVVKVVSLHQGVLKDVRDINLPFSNFRVLEPQLSHEDGKLHFVVASNENGISMFQLVNLAPQGEIKTEEVCSFNGDFVKYSIIYDEDLKLHMTWASKSGEIFYTWLGFEESARAKAAPQKLVKGKPPILDLQLSKASEDEEGRLRLLLNFVNCESADKLHAQLVNVQTGSTVLHSFHSLPELEDLTLLQTILDLECKPHFLFQDRMGALWFKSFESAIPVKVTKKDETYPGNIDFPVLLVSSNMSRNYGIYLRYLKDQRNFVCKKLTALHNY